MAQAEWLLLPHRAHVRHARNLLRGLQQRGFVALGQRVLEFKADVEMVFHQDFAAPGHDDDLVAAGSNRLFHAVLNDRLVDDRQHLFRHDLGGRKKPRAHARGREYCFTNFHAHHFTRCD